MEIGMPLEQFLLTMSAIVGVVIALQGPLGLALESQVAELHERLEFAERLLARDHQHRPM
jgi:hypothetical protein